MASRHGHMSQRRAEKWETAPITLLSWAECKRRKRSAMRHEAGLLFRHADLPHNTTAQALGPVSGRPYVAELSHAVKEKAVTAQDFAPHSTGVQALHLPRPAMERGPAAYNCKKLRRGAWKKAVTAP